MMTVLPMIQLILLSNAASNEVKHVKTVVMDNDQSQYSQRLIAKIKANDRFVLTSTPFSGKQAMEYMQANEADIILEIPQNFEKALLRKERPAVQLLANSINGQQATVGSGYINSIISDFNTEIIHELTVAKPEGIVVTSRNWYNPELEYSHFMAPGILAEITALLTIILTAMNTVREREIGTIEQINVTPIKKWQFILGKLIPFLCVGMVLLTVGLITSKIIFDIPMRGSLLLLFGYALINSVAVLGLGLLISNFADTQQQAIFVAFFFILIFVMMCGLFTPIDSMPKWAQYLTIPNPLAHFISVSRKILMKGSGLIDIKMELLYTVGLAVLFNVMAIWSYRKQN